MLEQIILYSFLAATAVQLFFWLYFFSRLAFYKESLRGGEFESLRAVFPFAGFGFRFIGSKSGGWRGGDEQAKGGKNENAKGHNPSAVRRPPSTVIICAHNEAANLEAHLDRFLNQNYRSFTVMVVSHNSCDKSLNILSSLQHRFKHLKIVECNDRRTGKKHALAKGISEAETDILVLTDADCVPVSEDWLGGMMEKIGGDTDIVLGFSPYMEAPGFLNKFIRFEAVYTALQYLSFALAGVPYMGVGRNLAYRKELYFAAEGFKKHEDIASGDDDLFVNEVATGKNTAIQLDPRTFVFSKPNTTWRAYFRQKTRHFSTGKKYKLQHKILLSALAVSHYLHYFLGALIVILNFSIIFALLGYAVRMCVVMAFSSIILKRLQHENLRFWVPALDVLLVLFYIAFAPVILMNSSNTQRWN
ncbi:MAG TPA: glycosyltransferase [Bacteroidetes bacterium]|nr:glycosyltransferase [Bacteroidota bacterium]